MSRCSRSASRAPPTSVDRSDGLQLRGVRITNAVKCLPPDNKPLPAEIKTCNQYLAAELERADLGEVDPGARHGGARGGARWRCGLKRSAAKFGHGAEYELPGGAAAGRFVSLQPLQHADAPADRRDVPDGAETGRDARGFTMTA